MSSTPSSCCGRSRSGRVGSFAPGAWCWGPTTRWRPARTPVHSTHLRVMAPATLTGADTMPPTEELYTAARRVIDAGLAADDSAFTPGIAIWTAAAADDLHARFVLAPDTGRDSFLTKFRRQLTGAPATTVQLAAELLYLHLLAPDNMGGPAKRAVLAGTLGLLPEPVKVPGDLDAALDGGFAHVGTAYLTQDRKSTRLNSSH